MTAAAGVDRMRLIREMAADGRNGAFRGTAAAFGTKQQPISPSIQHSLSHSQPFLSMLFHLAFASS